MEKELNIAAILKDKPEGTKLWSPIFGNCTLDKITSEDSLICVYTTENVLETFYPNGKYDRRGECVIFPSKQMQDWEKFAWEKGDMLVSNDSDCHIIFEDFSKDDYTTFEGKHWTSVSIKRYISCLDAQDTQDYHIEDDKNAAQTYINTIEERLGGKLNLEPEFKDGDIVCILGMGYLAYGIVKSINNSSKKLEYYVLNDMSTLKFKDWLSFEDKQIQPITETQQIILFEALAKKGKRWYPDTKQIENLPKGYEFKTMDWCLIQILHKSIWMLAQYASKYKGFYYFVGGLRVRITKECTIIPYNEETKHLLGTTDKWKGGK